MTDTPQTQSERLRILLEWQTTMGATPESKLVDAVSNLQMLATKQASRLTDVGYEMLEAWWLEHDLGDKPMKAGLKDEPLRDIKTLEELMALICDDEVVAT